MASKSRSMMVRVDEAVYNALVKQKHGMMSMSDVVRRCLEATGQLEKEPDDPFWYQSRLLEMPEKTKKRQENMK